MNHYTKLFTALTFTLSLVAASHAKITDWRELKAEYQHKAHEKVDPINKEYRDSLEKLLRRDNSGELDTDQRHIMDELEALDGNPALLLSTASYPISLFEGEWVFDPPGDVTSRVQVDANGNMKYILPDSGTWQLRYDTNTGRYIDQPNDGTSLKEFSLIDEALVITQWPDHGFPDKSPEWSVKGRCLRASTIAKDSSELRQLKDEYREKARKGIERINERYNGLLAETLEDISSYASVDKIQKVQEEIEYQKKHAGNLMETKETMISSSDLPFGMIGKWLVEWSNSKKEIFEITGDGNVVIRSDDSGVEESFEITYSGLLQKNKFKRGQAVIAVFVEDKQLKCMAWSQRQRPSSDRPLMTGVGHPPYQIIEGKFTWHEAKADAEKRGGHLAVITSKEEWDVVKLMVPKSGLVWMGGTDEKEEGKWEWVTGEPWTFDAWGNNEPNNYKDEDYLDSCDQRWCDSTAEQLRNLPELGFSYSIDGYVLEIERVSSAATDANNETQQSFPKKSTSGDNSELFGR